jgi:HopA1 effector protein family
MASAYREQVVAAIRATAIHPPIGYSWFGKISPPFPNRLVRSITSRSARTSLLFQLQSQLYTDFYCKGSASPASDDETPLPGVETIEFVTELAAASRAPGYCENNGWRVSAINKDRVLVRRGGLEVWARPRDCVNGHGRLIRGARVSLRSPRALPHISPGFYFVLGKTHRPYRRAPLVRFYWNLTVEGAMCFLAKATKVLDDAGVPFSLKVANHPRRFNRCDAGVLYLRHQDCEPSFESIAKIFAKVGPYLKPGVPALTKPLAPGLGWAEDPNQHDSSTLKGSFGTHRCYLLADGIIRAHERGSKSLEARLQVVERRFKTQGISLEEPFRDCRYDRRYTLDHLAARLTGPIAAPVS